MSNRTWIFARWPIAALVIGIALAGASAVSAETAPARPKGPHEAAVGAKQVVEQLEKAGYQNVHDLEWDDGFWEVEAVSPKGLPVDLVVDPMTGKILHEEVD